MGRYVEFVLGNVNFEWKYPHNQTSKFGELLEEILGGLVQRYTNDIGEYIEVSGVKSMIEEKIRDFLQHELKENDEKLLLSFLKAIQGAPDDFIVCVFYNEY